MATEGLLVHRPATLKSRFLLIVCLLWALSSTSQAEPSRLDLALARGELRVGTTGDYLPFSHLEGQRYSGFDIELAQLIATQLNIKLTLVPTTWKSLVDDLEAGRFDFAVGGITRTLERQTRAHFSKPILEIGKCALVRVTDAKRFSSLQSIDQPGVRIGVNPGGTNELYVRQNIHRASIVVIEDNLKIPDLVAEEKLDVMLTDNVEALNEAHTDRRLMAVSADSPWTTETLAILLPRDDRALAHWIDLFLEISQADGTLTRLKAKYGLPLKPGM